MEAICATMLICSMIIGVFILKAAEIISGNLLSLDAIYILMRDMLEHDKKINNKSK